MKKCFSIVCLLLASIVSFSQVNGTATFFAKCTGPSTFDYYVIPSASFTCASGGISSLTIVMQSPGTASLNSSCGSNATAPVFSFSNLISGMTVQGVGLSRQGDGSNTSTLGTATWNTPYNFNGNALAGVTVAANDTIKLFTVTTPVPINCTAVIDFPNNRLGGGIPGYGCYINMAVASGQVNESPSAVFTSAQATNTYTNVPAATNGADATFPSVMPLNFTAAPLPVIFNSFTAKAANCENVLNWVTSTEINSSRYEVQHSSTGSNFVTVGTVTSNNNSNGSAYSFTHNKPAPGTNFYRIRAVDFDGRSSTTSVVSVKNTCGGGGVITAGPNPTHDIINVYGLNGSNRIMVLNNLAQIMTSVQNNTPTQVLQTAAFAKGTYFIRVINDGGIITNIKFVKQ